MRRRVGPIRGIVDSFRPYSKLMLVPVAVTTLYLLVAWSGLRGSNSGRLGSQPMCNWSQEIFISTAWQQTPAGVPMLLHLVYRDANILEAYRANLESCTRLNANWTVVLWTDDSVRRFINREFPSLRKVFYGYRHKIQRADAIRYLILWRYGGVYLDLDMRCRQPLLTSLASVACFLDKEREDQTQSLHTRRYYAMNSAMGCTARHPFFRLMVDSVFSADRLVGRFHFPSTIFDTTGPGILTRLYEKWTAERSVPAVTLLSETYFSPKMDPSLLASCRSIVKTLGKTNRRSLTARQAICLKLAKIGFEKSDDMFVTNQTVAIHQFSHLGYKNQKSGTFDAAKAFPGLLTYGGGSGSNRSATSNDTDVGGLLEGRRMFAGDIVTVDCN